MLISFNWLKDYVKLPDSVTPEEVAEKLKLSTVEVEGLKKEGLDLENIVVGKVLTAEKHPQADKLLVCEVDLGKEKEKIVCGGSNVKVGMLVAFAKLGAKVKWHGEGEFITLEKASIRGVESRGMICGADEIGLLELFPKDDEKEIVDLSNLKKIKPGQPVSEALNLNDVIFEIDNKSLSNRPDLWGHFGIAREVAVLFNRVVADYKEVAIKGKNTAAIEVKVEDQIACPRYMAVAVGGVKIGPSPDWLKKRLISVGLRPVNVVVDITNYVMMDLGQPLHAFDGRELETEKGKYEIVLRFSKPGEKFTTLDEKERELPDETLLISTSKEPIAIAGIMGGLKSGINSETETVVFEAANFNAAIIRKASAKLGLRTDSSSRFEKSLDPNLCETALKKAVQMLLELSPGSSVVSKVVDVGNGRMSPGVVHMPVSFIKEYLGIEIPVKNIVSTLERLGFRVDKKDKFLEITIPSWRTKDVQILEDIVEEVARIFGYHNISSSLPTFPVNPPLQNKLRKLERIISDLMVKELAYSEVYNYSFVSEYQIRKIGDELGNYLQLDNPLSKERPYLRRSLLLNILEVLEKNEGRGRNIRVFEIGMVYKEEVAGLRVSDKGSELLPGQDLFFLSAYCDKKDDRPFNKAKQVIESLQKELNLNFEVSSDETSGYMHPGRSGNIILEGEKIGEIFELHPKIAKEFGLQGRISMVSLNLSLLSEKFLGEKKNIKSLSLYPEIERDLAFVINKNVTHLEITKELEGIDLLLKGVKLFDTYEGESLGEGKKSMAYHLVYSHPDRTLTSEEAEKMENKIKDILQRKWQVEFR